jgi:hypothetical protein
MPWTPIPAQAGLKIWSFEQVTPADVWTITHGMDDMPVADISVNVNGVYMKAFPKSQTYPDNNTIVIEWTSPQTGYVVFTAY